MTNRAPIGMPTLHVTHAEDPPLGTVIAHYSVSFSAEMSLATDLIKYMVYTKSGIALDDVDRIINVAFKLAEGVYQKAKESGHTTPSPPMSDLIPKPKNNTGFKSE